MNSRAFFVRSDCSHQFRRSFWSQSLEATIPAAEGREQPIPHRDAVVSTKYRNREWAKVKLGTLRLPKCPATLTLEALSKPGAQVMDLKHFALKFIR